MASELEQKIIKQIEYYFGDYSLPKDKFLQEKIGEDEGWVAISVLLTFQRLASITTDAEVIVEALKKSENELVVVSEDGLKVRRNPEKIIPELTDDRKKEIMGRTAYAKGFPLEEHLDDIMKYFEDNHGPFESCVKRSFLDRASKERKFKGSCFIVFKTLEDCKKFIEAENAKYKDVDLIRKYQLAYFDEKKQEFQDRKNTKKKEKEIEEPKLTFPKGIIFHFSCLPEDAVLTREEIKLKITEINEAQPAYVDYNKGDKEGYVRMSNENGAVEFNKKLPDGVIEIGDVKLEVSVLEGEDEDKYMKKAAEVMQKRRQFQKKGKKNNKRQNTNNDGPKGKRAKV